MTISRSAAFCWGSNLEGEAGQGLVSGSIPRPAYSVVTVPAWADLSLGDGYSCGIAAGRTSVYCWGSSSFGILGPGAPGAASSPQLVVMNASLGVQAWTSIATGRNAVAATTLNGEVITWGSSASGKLGRGIGLSAAGAAPGPVVMTDSVEFLSVSGSYDTFVAVTARQQVYTWGAGADGQLGRGSVLPSLVPAPVALPSLLAAGGDAWSQCSAGVAHTCCVTRMGALLCWGQQSRGRLGSGGAGGIAIISTPVRVDMTALPAGTLFRTVSAGWDHTLAVTTANALYAFGDNTAGQLGLGQFTPNASLPSSFWTSPTLVNNWDGVLWTDAKAGAHYSGGTSLDGRLYTWGSSVSGRTGRGDSGANALSPALVDTSLLPADTRWSGITVGTESTCALAAGVSSGVVVVDLTAALACLAAGRVWDGTACASPPACNLTDPSAGFDGIACDYGYTAFECSAPGSFWNGVDCIPLAQAASLVPMLPSSPVATGQEVRTLIALTLSGITAAAFNTTEARTAFIQALVAALHAVGCGNATEASIVITSATPGLVDTGRRLEARSLAIVPTLAIAIFIRSSDYTDANIVYSTLVAANATGPALQVFSGALLEQLSALAPTVFADAAVLSLSPSTPVLALIGGDILPSASPAPGVGAASTASASSALSGGAIAGAVIGAIAIFGILLAVRVYAQRRSPASPITTAGPPAAPKDGIIAGSNAMWSRPAPKGDGFTGVISDGAPRGGRFTATPTGTTA